jgi:hypothetical protein
MTPEQEVLLNKEKWVADELVGAHHPVVVHQPGEAPTEQPSGIPRRDRPTAAAFEERQAEDDGEPDGGSQDSQLLKRVMAVTVVTLVTSEGHWGVQFLCRVAGFSRA